jgi:septal ring factor EnvC (AmiA/AmiB activator)
MKTRTHGRSRDVRRAFAASAALLFAFVVVPTAQAQEAPGQRRAPDPEQRIEQLKQRLDLSDQQVEQVRALMQEQQQKRQQAFEQARQQREAMRERMEQERTQMNERMADILNEEQLQKWHELQERMQRRSGLDRRPRGARRPPRDPAGPPPRG